MYHLFPLCYRNGITLTVKCTRKLLQRYHEAQDDKVHTYHMVVVGTVESEFITSYTSGRRVVDLVIDEMVLKFNKHT